MCQCSPVAIRREVSVHGVVLQPSNSNQREGTGTVGPQNPQDPIAARGKEAVEKKQGDAGMAKVMRNIREAVREDEPFLGQGT